MCLWFPPQDRSSPSRFLSSFVFLFHASFASTVLKKGTIVCTPSRLIIKSRNAGPFSITGVADAVSDSDSDL